MTVADGQGCVRITRCGACRIPGPVNGVKAPSEAEKWAGQWVGLEGDWPSPPRPQASLGPGVYSWQNTEPTPASSAGLDPGPSSAAGFLGDLEQMCIVAPVLPPEDWGQCFLSLIPHEAPTAAAKAVSVAFLSLSGSRQDRQRPHSLSVQRTERLSSP